MSRKEPQDRLKAVQDKPPVFSQDEIDLATAQENAEFQRAQLQYLQNRVATLRIEVNRLDQENAQLKEGKQDE